jgi:UDP-3-O-[3-hydroxymyristoyl] glucosamine N-acyltransferase
MAKQLAATGTQIAGFLNSTLLGESTAIRILTPFPNAEPASISFCSAKSCSDLSTPPADSLVLALGSAAPALCEAGYRVIESHAPKYDLARVYRQFFRPPNPVGVHPSAVVGAEVNLGRAVCIGPGSVLDGPVDLGEGVVLGANVRIQGPATLGARVSIGSSAVIGEEAFSFGFAADGQAARFPATGGVVIEDDVEIGASTFVAAGVFEPTRIEASAKLADLVSISNAVHIGRNSIVTARCSLSGRVWVGRDCWIGQSAAIRQGVAVGDGAMVGMGAVVVKDVPPGKVVMGNPASVKRDR